MKTIIISIKNTGTVRFELWEENAPIATEHFLKMIDLRKYDNKPIERYEPGFVLQPLFQDGLDKDIDELVELEANDDIRFERGTVAMAGYETAASGAQFFITLERAERLDGKFTVIGKVTDGIATIEKLEKLPVEERIDEPTGFIYHRFTDDIIIESIRVQE